MIHKTNIIKKQNSVLNYDWQLVSIVSVMCVLGLAFLASSLNVNIDRYSQEVTKQAVFGLGLGSILALIFARLDYHRLLKHTKWIVIVAFLSLSFLGIFGFLQSLGVPAVRSVSFLPIKPILSNGAVRWLDLPLGLPALQPSEFAKLVMLIYFAHSLGKYGTEDELNWGHIKRPIWVMVAFSFVMLLQPDLGTTALIWMAVGACMWRAKVSYKLISILSLICLAVGIFAILSQGYRQVRLTENDQVRNIKIAVASGGMWGKGYGNSDHKQPGSFNRIFFPDTDSIIAVIAEEIGFVGTVLFLSLYIYLFMRGMKIASESKDMEGKILATGISVLILLQVFLNIYGMTGLMPMKGLPLPFVSKGGSSLWTNLMAIGILLNISSQKDRKPQNLQQRLGLKRL